MALFVFCKTLLLCIFFLTMLPLQVSGNGDCTAPIIQVSSSSVRGSCSIFTASELGIKCEVASYRGLRYAKSPTGPRRFAPSELQDLDLDVDGTRGGPSCPQGPHPVYNTETGTDEDCLFLDVFVPLPQRSTPRAVMVWIHGGGFMFGAGTVSMLSPLPLVSMGDVIVVTINYRLGALGFLTTGDESIPPNLGILDQITALKWIRKYINAFGGDPDRVTLFGDSAGSASIHIHLMSPLSSGLFHRAILQSGTMTSSWAKSPDIATAHNRSFTLGRILGCDGVLSSGQLKECLMQVPAGELVAKQQEVLTELNDDADIAFVPVVDHALIPDSPDIMGVKRFYNNVSIIIGANNDEGMMTMMNLFPDATTTPVITRRQMQEHLSTAIKVHDPVLLGLIELIYDIENHHGSFLHESRSKMYSDRTDIDLSDDDNIFQRRGENIRCADHDRVEASDPNNDFNVDSVIDEGHDDDETCNEEPNCNVGNDKRAGFFDKLNDVVGDMTMFCPTVAVADFAAEAGLKVYRYHMTHRPSESFWRPLRWTRVNHGENLLFVFGVHFLPHLNWTLTPEEGHMTSQIIQYWTNFASSGDPNYGDNTLLVKNLPRWPLYDPNSSALSKNLSPAMTDDAFIKSQKCKFWNNIFPHLRTFPEP